MDEQAVLPIALPDSAQGCRDRLVELQDEISSIRIQIATTDIRRQAERRGLDPNWYHRAKTALRLKQQELSQVSAQLGRLAGDTPGARRARFKDRLLALLRTQVGEACWSEVVTRAQAPEGRDG